MAPPQGLAGTIPLCSPVSDDDYGQFGPAMDLDWTGDGTCTLNSGVDWQYLYLEFPQ